MRLSPVFVPLMPYSAAGMVSSTPLDRNAARLLNTVSALMVPGKEDTSGED